MHLVHFHGMSEHSDMHALPAPENFRLHIEPDSGIGWLLFDRAHKRNAFNLAMWRALPEAVETLTQQANNVRVIVLRGLGGHFGAGADIAEFETVRAGRAAEDYDRIHERSLKALEQAHVPTIAMVEGYCLGGGLAIALACDLRISADDALFALPPARLGLAFPLDALARLRTILSAAHAAELLFTGERFDASWALRTGLINAAYPAKELEAHVRKRALRIAANAPLSLKYAKAAIAALWSGRLNEERGTLQALARACYESADYEEGRRAFLERRTPVFRGR